jgi:hypothetical protein
MLDENFLYFFAVLIFEKGIAGNNFHDFGVL